MQKEIFIRQSTLPKQCILFLMKLTVILLSVGTEALFLFHYRKD